MKLNQTEIRISTSVYIEQYTWTKSHDKEWTDEQTRKNFKHWQAYLKDLSMALDTPIQ